MFDLDKELVASTFEQLNLNVDLIMSFGNSVADSQIVSENHLFKISDEAGLAYIFSGKRQ